MAHADQANLSRLSQLPQMKDQGQVSLPNSRATKISPGCPSALNTDSKAVQFSSPTPIYHGNRPLQQPQLPTRCHLTRYVPGFNPFTLTAEVRLGTIKTRLFGMRGKVKCRGRRMPLGNLRSSFYVNQGPNEEIDTSKISQINDLSETDPKILRKAIKNRKNNVKNRQSTLFGDLVMIPAKATNSIELFLRKKMI
ncbi:hypothetical protein DFH09DRAFT_1102486 [Mycena vulgaris]|nr:hypothetical protein DFH09DRAFT_1102486 [Mycena vulgaris]